MVAVVVEVAAAATAVAVAAVSTEASEVKLLKDVCHLLIYKLITQPLLLPLLVNNFIYLFIYKSDYCHRAAGDTRDWLVRSICGI